MKRMGPGAALALLALASTAGCSSPHAVADAGPDAYLPPALAKGFPAGFLFGSATSPYQVEGNLHGDDYYEWEKLGKIPSGESADNGPDEYDHYDEDFAAAQAMGNNAARLGIDWSRLFPTAAQLDSSPPAPDPTAVAHYHAVLASLKAHGLVPMVTLWHFASPLWIDDPDPSATNPPKGWLDPNTVTQFATFCGWAAKEYGGEVDLWLTLNEPFIYLGGAYMAGVMPPGERGAVKDALAALKNMIAAHARCYDAIKANDTATAIPGGAAPALVSFAQHSRVYTPKDPSSAQDVEATRLLHELDNTFFLDAVTAGNEDWDFDGAITAGGADDVADPTLAGRLDYIGLNYYGKSEVTYVNKSLWPFEGLPLSDDLMDGSPETDVHWDVDAPGFRTVLDELQPYKLPVYVTENGVADQGDVLRQRYLLDHLYVLQKAINDGYDIRGYFYWALVDNFEWSSGFCPHFGLLHYDPTTKARRPSPAVAVYQAIIQANAVTPRMFAQYPRYGSPTFCPPLGGF